MRLIVSYRGTHDVSRVTREQRGAAGDGALAARRARRRKTAGRGTKPSRRRTETPSRPAPYREAAPGAGAGELQEVVLRPSRRPADLARRTGPDAARLRRGAGP